MPGAYAHITIVNHLREPQRLEGIADFPIQAIPMILDYFKYCELGAVSPDYPYLAIGSSGAAEWADTMHYEKTGDVIKTGIRLIQELSDEQVRAKCVAWLLGYTAHVVTDVTIHPIVQLKVGPYADNKTDHRICEMNQDAYIFRRLNLGEVGLSEHLDSGICACVGDDDNMDENIKSLWLAILSQVYSKHINSNPPDLEAWHSGFRKVVDIAEEGNKLFPLARHVAVDLGLTYPAEENIDNQYINDLRTPIGIDDYDAIFDKAVDNVGRLWSIVSRGILEGDNSYMEAIGNWNLDTGEDPNGKIVFWG